MENLQEQLTEKRTEKKQFELILTEKQRASKDAYRARQKLEHQVHSEVYEQIF